MDNLKIILILAMLLLEACSRSSEQPGAQTQPEACKPYPSTYQVEFPDHTVKESIVSACGAEFMATQWETTGGAGESFTAAELVVVVTNTVTGQPAYIRFDGQ